jgi:hypothetical protein
VPLPFLTADRAFDEVADDVALPFDDRDQWRRPYRPGPWRVGFAALLLLLASYVMFGAALRLLRVGTWVSAHGLRRVAFFQTQTVPWAQVVTVRTVQQPVRWLGLPRTVQGQALLLVRRDKADERSALVTSHGADFLARTEAFDRASDAIEVWAEEYRPHQA